jgi:hypothetical protein
MNPIMAKGGVHEKPTKTKRNHAKRELGRWLASNGRESGSYAIAA